MRCLILNRLMSHLVLALVVVAAVAAEKPRLLVLTDIGGDPDDQQSLIRLMVYANEFAIEGLVASAAGTPGELKSALVRPDLIRGIVRAYEAVRPNLIRHASGWPTPEALLKSIRTGSPRRGRAHIGPGHDTDGSRWIIESVDRGSVERPLNVTIWGGQTDLAQALWSVRAERGPTGYADFVGRLRVFAIADQDFIADWLRVEFPGMYYIQSSAPTGRDKREATFRGMYLTGDESLTSRAWVDRHVLPSGPLGALYPTKTWTAPNPHACVKEGDTPSWFFFLPAGHNDPSNPLQPGWGGQYQKSADGWYRDRARTESFDPRTSVSDWRPRFQADFARRLAWCQGE